MIKERKPEIKPCERGGEDNISRDNPAKFCRLLKDGLCERAFLHNGSSGFLEKGSSGKVQMAFKGCQSLEETLIEEKMVLYNSKEISGLEVLFRGTEAMEDLKSEIFNGSNFHCDVHDHVSTQADRFNNESFMYSSKFVRRSIEAEEPDNESSKKSDELAIDQRSVAPKFMGLGASLMADICANQPEDLFHTTLIRLWNDNFFEEKDRELQVTAYAMMKFHYPQYFLDKVWDGSKSSPKAKRLKAHVRHLVNKEMNEIFVRFKKFTDAISETQYKVFQTEHRRDNGYLSQKEKALMLGLKHDNYKYHLKRCEEVLFKIYPEFEKKYRRIKGGKTAKETKSSPETLYRIVNGKRKEIPFPEKKKRQLSGREAFKIRRWAFETTYNKNGNLATTPDFYESPTQEEKLKDMFSNIKYEDVI